MLAACDFDAATPVDYVAQRDADKPPASRGSYRVLEDVRAMSGKRKSDPVLDLRRVFVC